MRNIIGMLLPAITLAGLAAGISLLLKEKMAKGFALSAGLLVAVLYAFALFGQVFLGLCAAFALGMAGWGLTVYRALRRREAPQGMGTAMVVYAALFALALYANGSRVFGAWDEFSHWGLAARVLREQDDLARAAQGLLIFTDYPPASTLFIYFFTRLLPAFDEGMAYVAMNMLCACVMMPLIEGASLRKPGRLLATVLLAALLPAVILSTTYTEIYVDALLGLLTGMALCHALVKTRTRGDMACFAATLALLVWTKAAGLGLALIVLLVAFDRARGEKEYRMFLFGAGATLAAKGTWSLYMALLGQTSVWDMSRVGAFSLGEAQKDTILRFLRALSERDIFGYWVPVTFVMAMALFAFGAFFLVRSADKARGERLKRAFALSGVCAIGYALSLLLLYMTVYAPSEGTVLASFERYLSTIVMALWLFVFGVGVREGESVQGKTLLACGAVLLVTGNVGMMGYRTVTAPMEAKTNVPWRMSYLPIEQASKLRGENERVFIASGLDSSAEWYVARYTAMLPLSAVNSPREANMGSAQAPDAQAWMETLQNEYAYVYVCVAGKGFSARYEPCFETSIEENTLYRVDREKALLVKVGQ